MNYRIAPSYEKEGWKIVRVEGKKAQIENTCSRCGGSGMYPSMEYNGICLRCNGSGKEYKVVKAYTESEYNAYVKNQEKTRKRKAEEEAQRIENLKLHSEENMKARLIEWGFDPNDPVMYVIVGENTYAIKDTLKERDAILIKILDGILLIPLISLMDIKKLQFLFLAVILGSRFLKSLK